MALKGAVKTQIRSHLGYSAIGLPANSQYANPLRSASSLANTNWHLENRMQQLSPEEEAYLTGSAYGAIVIQRNPITPGDTVTATISGGGLSAPEVLVITAVSGDTNMSLLNKIALAGKQNVNLVAHGFESIAPWGSGPFADDQSPYPQMNFTAPAAFVLGVIGSGSIGASVTDSGGLSEPSVVVSKRPPKTVYGLVPICNYMLTAIGGSTRNQDILKADVATLRITEMDERQDLYDFYCQKLSDFLKVPMNSSQAGKCTF